MQSLVPEGGRTVAEEKPGYDDTPIIPGSNWRVHYKYQ